MAYLILHENEGGEIGRKKVAREDKLKSALLDYVDELGSVQPGDTFRVVDENA